MAARRQTTRQNTTRAVARRQEQPSDVQSQTREEEDRRKMRALVEAVADKRAQLEALLAGQLDVERFITVALQAVQSKPALLACDRLSLLGAIRDAATYGLEPAGELGDAAIVPRKNVAHLEIEYRGLRKLALRDGRVFAIDADVVYEKDHFRIVSGSAPLVDHVPSLEVQRGAPMGAYAWARFANGELVYLWMPMAEILQRRQESQAWRQAEKDGTNDSIWHKWPREQEKKTVLRRLILEKLPMSPLAREALVIDTLADRSAASTADVLVSAAPAGSDARRNLLRRMGLDGPAAAPQLPAGADANSPASANAVGRAAAQPSEVDADSGATDSGRPGPSESVTAEKPATKPLAPIIEAREAEGLIHPAGGTTGPSTAEQAAAAEGTTLELCEAPSPYAAEGKPSTCRKLKGHEATDDPGALMHKGAHGETWKVE